MAKDLDELLACYAIDAVDDEERREVEALLERSSDARQLLRAHIDALAALHDGHHAAPPAIWREIEARIAAPESAPEDDSG